MDGYLTLMGSCGTQGENSPVTVGLRLGAGRQQVLPSHNVPQRVAEIRAPKHGGIVLGDNNVTLLGAQESSGIWQAAIVMTSCAYRISRVQRLRVQRLRVQRLRRSTLHRPRGSSKHDSF